MPRAAVGPRALGLAVLVIARGAMAQTAPYGTQPYAQQQPYPPQQQQAYPPQRQQPYPPQQQQPYPPQQQQPYPQQQKPYPQQQPYPPPQQPYPQQATPPRPAQSNESSLFELGTLYGTSAGYGVGLGIWLDAEMGVSDPGVSLIAPAVLGVAAPVGVYFLDQPSMPRGEPAAISAGLAIGAAEGLGIAGTQFVNADKADAWGFRGLSRSVAIGATLGGASGYAFGELEEPSPKLSAVVSSGAAWGTLIGASFGYGASPGGVGYGRSNDSAAVGGLVGMNVGLLATAGLSLAVVPSWHQIEGMWEGAGIGAAASLPVFLFYAGKSTPPAKRGLLFTGTAMLLGIVAGGVFSSSEDDPAPRAAGARGGAASRDRAAAFASLTSIVPFPTRGGAGLSLSGVLY